MKKNNYNKHITEHIKEVFGETIPRIYYLNADGASYFHPAVSQGVLYIGTLLKSAFKKVTVVIDKNLAATVFTRNPWSGKDRYVPEISVNIADFDNRPNLYDTPLSKKEKVTDRALGIIVEEHVEVLGRYDAGEINTLQMPYREWMTQDIDCNLVQLGALSNLTYNSSQDVDFTNVILFTVIHDVMHIVIVGSDRRSIRIFKLDWVGETIEPISLPLSNFLLPTEVSNALHVHPGMRWKCDNPLQYILPDLLYHLPGDFNNSDFLHTMVDPEITLSDAAHLNFADALKLGVGVKDAVAVNTNNVGDLSIEAAVAEALECYKEGTYIQLQDIIIPKMSRTSTFTYASKSKKTIVVITMTLLLSKE